jgi:hypothetical protein
MPQRQERQPRRTVHLPPPLQQWWQNASFQHPALQPLQLAVATQSLKQLGAAATGHKLSSTMQQHKHHNTTPPLLVAPEQLML